MYTILTFEPAGKTKAWSMVSELVSPTGIEMSSNTEPLVMRPIAGEHVPDPGVKAFTLTLVMVMGTSFTRRVTMNPLHVGSARSPSPYREINIGPEDPPPPPLTVTQTTVPSLLI